MTTQHVLSRRTTLAGILGLAAAGLSAGSADAATKGEAKALVANAIKRYDAQPQAVIDAVNQGAEGEFRKGELYMVIQETGPQPKVVAHGGNAKLKGTPLSEIKDEKGRLFALDISKRATEKGAWFSYDYLNPVTGKVQPKITWAVRHQSLVFLCGIYKT